MKPRFRFSLPRRDDGTLLPAALSLVLAVAVALQLFWAAPPDLPDQGVGRVARVDAGTARDVIGVSPVLLARPLFAPGRRAGGLSASGGGESALGGALVVGVAQRGRVARLFVRMPDGEIRTMAMGQALNGWRLVALGADAARFRRGGEAMAIAYGSAAPADTADEEEEDSDEE